MYFGFTHCPDICPEELDKMAEVLDTVSTLSRRRDHSKNTRRGSGSPLACNSFSLSLSHLLFAIDADPEIGNVITPIFITCDPQRDTVAEVYEYVKGKSLFLVSTYLLSACITA